MAFKMIEKRTIFSNLFTFDNFDLPVVLSPGKLVRLSLLRKFRNSRRLLGPEQRKAL